MTQETTIQKSSLGKKISWSMVLSGVTGLLVLIVVMQSFQLAELKGYTEGMQIQKVQAATNDLSAPVPAAPVRTQNSGLPSQVGGC